MVTAPRASLVVNEIFASIQGEGLDIGVPTTFIRLAGCNLRCSWCDTSYTWDWRGQNGIAYNPVDEMHTLSFPEILEQITTQHVVITGGEPLLQQGTLTPFLEQLHARGIFVEIETNGTILPTFSAELVGRFNVSLKLDSAGNDGLKRRNEAAIAWFRASNRAIWKFVVANYIDFVDVLADMRIYDLPHERVLLMPLGATRAEMTSNLLWLLPYAQEAQLRVTPRLHILLYDDKRAV